MPRHNDDSDDDRPSEAEEPEGDAEDESDDVADGGSDAASRDEASVGEGEDDGRQLARHEVHLQRRYKLPSQPTGRTRAFRTRA